MMTVSIIPNSVDFSKSTLWRYMTIEKLIDLLETKKLFLSPIKHFEQSDPFEGLHPKWYLDDLRIKVENHYDSILTEYPAEPRTYKVIEEIKSKTKDIYIKTIKGITINCWHINDSESEAMWKIYSDNNKGIAIKTNFISLKNCIECEVQDFDVQIGKVEYIDFNSNNVKVINFDPSMPLWKRNSFKHENELRVFILHKPDEDILPKTLNVDINTLIHEIVISPFANDIYVNSVKSICEKYNIKSCLVKKSSLLDSADEYLSIVDTKL